MLDIRAREKHAILGGHVRRSLENVIAGKKRERSGTRGSFFYRARSRIDGKRVRKQFSERSCLASETAFVARRPRHVRRTAAVFAFRTFKKKLPRAFTGVIHAVNRRCAARAFCIPPIQQAYTSKSATRLANVTKIVKSVSFFPPFEPNYFRGLILKQLIPNKLYVRTCVQNIRFSSINFIYINNTN